MIPLCLSRGAGYLAVKLDLSSAKMDSFRIGNGWHAPISGIGGRKAWGNWRNRSWYKACGFHEDSFVNRGAQASLQESQTLGLMWTTISIPHPPVTWMRTPRSKRLRASHRVSERMSALVQASRLLSKMLKERKQKRQYHSSYHRSIPQFSYLKLYLRHRVVVRITWEGLFYKREVVVFDNFSRDRAPWEWALGSGGLLVSWCFVGQTSSFTADI